MNISLTSGHKIKKEDEYSLYGTMIYNYQKQSIGILIKTWDNAFWSEEGLKYYPFATCVDREGKRYNASIDDITPLDELDEKELKKLGLK